MPDPPQSDSISTRLGEVAADVYPSQSKSFQRTILVLATALVVMAFLLQRIPSDESSHLQLAGVRLPELCYSQKMFGLRCPGCGLTRSVVSSACGDLQSAIHFHPAGPLIFGWAFVQIPYRLMNLWRLRTGKLAWRTPGTLLMTFVIVAVCLVQWVVGRPL